MSTVTSVTSVRRGPVIAWGLWDWGSSAYNAVILTFVFSVYLTDSVGKGLPGSIDASAWLGYALGAAGLVIALAAPVLGQRADSAGRRKLSTVVWTILTVVVMGALFVVRDDYTYLWIGLLLLSLGSIFYELASVSYNAMLVQVCSPANMGRVSGFGWSMGYFGGIVLLLAVYTGLIAGDGDTRGLLGVPTEGGLNIRVVAVVAAVWFLVFALPLFLRVPEVPPAPDREARLGVVGSYRKLFRDLAALYRSSPQTVFFLVASALFRDGLAAIFTFGAVLAVTVYGIGAGDVLIFGIAANVVSAAGALTAGWLEDRTGPKPVIVGSLIGLILDAVVLLFVSGPVNFWIFGLILTLFVGPAQSSSRTFLARLAPGGREGQLFGLYATTGRAVSFIAPTLFALFTSIFGAPRAGIVGILLVLVAGLAALLPVRPPQRTPA
ncbi:MFS transporter [Pseudonocardia sp.]|uniref:MFS transporter n=1 Tax=Pseudonocardia sp. TaxID=60912 RepID=UPI00262AFDF6|nr:MFS transporter [Pseudonocardia sp.]MCW2721565.1 major facilitator superfamily 1 [Pseudonocardia sp.]